MTQEELQQQIQATLESIELPDNIPPSPLEADSLVGMFQQAFSLAIHQPEHLAIGWWLSALLFLIVVVTITTAIYIVKKRNRYRKWALAELKTLAKVCDDGEFTRACASLVKRTVVYAIDRNAASHFGDAWRQQLLHYYPKFDQQAAEAITVGQYKADTPVAKDELYRAIKQWLRRHKRKAYTC